MIELLARLVFACGRALGILTAFPHDTGLYYCFLKQCKRTPDKAAVVSTSDKLSLSYESLNQQAIQLSYRLKATGVGHESAIGVLMKQRIEHIVVQLAISIIGGTCVPLDPDYPIERLELMIKKSKVTTIVTEKSTSTLLPEFPIQICIESTAVLHDASLCAAQGMQTDCSIQLGDHRAYVLFTSGSTGKPKGVEILAKGIIRTVCQTDYVNLGPQDRITQIANPCFDAALLEVWGALLNGATLVLIDKKQALQPFRLKETVAQENITVMYLSTSLFNLVVQFCPDAFKGLIYLLIGGETATVRTLRAVLNKGPPKHLVNCYGPTEGTIFSTTMEIRLSDLLKQTISIGRPIAYRSVYIFDMDGKPISSVGQTGEIFIAGDGLARGYCNRSDLTAERFFSLPVGSNASMVRLYRTGDFAQWGDDGNILFMGRADQQVKIRGFRIELVEIESYILQSVLVQSVVITVYRTAKGDNSLIAHVVPAVLIESSKFIQSLRTQLRSQIPSYMVPALFLLWKALPLNGNGKVDRNALKAKIGESKASTGMLSDVVDPLMLKVAETWRTVLDVAHVSPKDNFFDLGGDSLKAVEVCLLLQKLLGTQLSSCSALYESAALTDFVTRIRHVKDEMKNIASDPQKWYNDACLADELVLENNDVGSLREWHVCPESLIFLTGSTGFLGAHFLQNFLLNTDSRVACLVRRGHDQSGGLKRVEDAMRKYGLWNPAFIERIEPVLGDLTQSRFGLTDEDFQNLAASVQAIFHLGARVNYAEPYEFHRPANVIGTLEILRLAGCGRRKPLHYVSTIAVFGPTGFIDQKQRVFETEPLTPYANYIRYDIGYSQSKWVAEELMFSSIRRGLTITIYRPGFILGSHDADGIGNNDDFIARLVRGAIQLGAYPDLPNQSKQFVTADFVSNALLKFSKLPDCSGKVFHLVPPTRESTISINDFFKLINMEQGFTMEKLPYSKWIKRLQADPQVARNPLLPLLGMLCEPIYRNQLTRWELYERMPVYDTKNTREAMEKTGIKFYPMTSDLLASYLKYWIASG